MIDNIDKTTSLHLNNEAQFLCFTLEPDNGDLISQIYAMNVFKIREIIYYDDIITETAGKNDGVVIGYLTVRGEGIPLVDVKRWLYFNPNEPNKDLKEYSINSGDVNKHLTVICNFSNATVGLKIFNIKKIIQKNWEDIYVNGEHGFGNNKFTATTKFDDGNVIQIIDVERMLEDAFPILKENQHDEMGTLSSLKTNKIILLAEDSRAAQKSIEIILEKLELQYFTFPNGKVLLEYLESPGVLETVGAVITDLEMPVISGFEVLKRIRENPATKSIPVIINSSMSNDSNLEKAKSLQATAFVVKSHTKDIEEALKSALLKQDFLNEMYL